MKTMQGIFRGVILVTGTTVLLISCKKMKTPNEDQLLREPALPEVTYPYMEKHSVNSDLATLGRVLFYDRNLSVNNSISCGSCHKQEFAFADNVKFNKGFNGLNLKRNSPSIQGIKGFVSQDRYDYVNGMFTFIPKDGLPNETNQQDILLFWDGRQSKVADMVLNPVLNHNEMNVPDFETLVKKLEAVSYYPALFKKTYGDEKINKERIAYALEGFLACLNTPDPVVKFDSFGNPISGELNLSPIEEAGRKLFHEKYNCAKCHDPSHGGDYNSGTNPSLNPMFNIGLDEVYSDQGLGAITGKPGDQGLFKVPTLKNISVTAPYMHDGRFSNLGEVIDHYSHEIKPNANLSPLFRNFDGSTKKLNINAAEKQALIAFLNTLKDPDFLTSDMYSDPFKQ